MAYNLFTTSGASYTDIAANTLYELLTHTKIADIARILKKYDDKVVVLYDATNTIDVAMFLLHERMHLTYLDLRIVTMLNIRLATMSEYVCGTQSSAPCSLAPSSAVPNELEAPCSLARSSAAHDAAAVSSD